MLLGLVLLLLVRSSVVRYVQNVDLVMAWL